MSAKTTYGGISQQSKKKVQELQRSTSHGFSVHTSLKDLHEFFTTLPEDQEMAHRIEPPIFRKRKPSQTDRSRMKGLR